MENPETKVALVTRLSTKTSKTINTENEKDEQHGPHRKTRINPGAGEML